MKVTEIQIKLAHARNNERILAYVNFVADDALVIHDVKIIDGERGPFIAMPSRRLMDNCPRCDTRNHLRAAFCNDCGGRLDEARAFPADGGRAKLFTDACHPIRPSVRKDIEDAIFAAYSVELSKAELARGRKAVPA